MKPTQFRKINYQYTIDFEEVSYFDWDFQMGPVKYDGYEVLATSIDWIVESLNENPDTRQAILTLNRKDYMSCLINMQWLVDGATLHCITNFRSQHENWGRAQDSQLILLLTTQVKEELKTQIDEVKIHVNVADYHSYL